MGQSCTIPGNCHLPYTDEETRAVSGQLGGLGLVGGALKNTSAQAHPILMKHKLGVGLASWYFSKVALVTLICNSGQK